MAAPMADTKAVLTEHQMAEKSVAAKVETTAAPKVVWSAANSAVTMELLMAAG